MPTGVCANRLCANRLWHLASKRSRLSSDGTPAAIVRDRRDAALSERCGSVRFVQYMRPSQRTYILAGADCSAGAETRRCIDLWASANRRSSTVVPTSCTNSRMVRQSHPMRGGDQIGHPRKVLHRGELTDPFCQRLRNSMMSATDAGVSRIGFPITLLTSISATRHIDIATRVPGNRDENRRLM